MALVPKPTSPLDPWAKDAMTSPSSLWPALDRILGEFSSPVLSGTHFALNMYETDSHLAVDIAMPGIRPENLDVQVEGKTLIIRGRYEASSDDGKRYWARMLPTGDFQYSLALPVKVDADQVDASLEHGLLHLALPKAAEARTRKIEIKRIS